MAEIVPLAARRASAELADAHEAQSSRRSEAAGDLRFRKSEAGWWPASARNPKAGRSGGEAWASYKGKSRPRKAEICLTRDMGRWQDRKWETLPATIDLHTRRVTASIPEAARVYYLNLIDERGSTISNEHEEL